MLHNCIVSGMHGNLLYETTVIVLLKIGPFVFSCLAHGGKIEHLTIVKKTEIFCIDSDQCM